MCTLLTQNICLMCHTQGLGLGGDQIGDAGLTALAKAVESGTLPQLKQLWLSENKIGDMGVSALADTLGKGALPQLRNVYLDGNPGNAELVQSVLRERKGSK